MCNSCGLSHFKLSCYNVNFKDPVYLLKWFALLIKPFVEFLVSKIFVHVFDGELLVLFWYSSGFMILNFHFHSCKLPNLQDLQYLFTLLIRLIYTDRIFKFWFMNCWLISASHTYQHAVRTGCIWFLQIDRALKSCDCCVSRLYSARYWESYSCLPSVHYERPWCGWVCTDQKVR